MNLVEIQFRGSLMVKEIAQTTNGRRLLAPHRDPPCLLPPPNIVIILNLKNELGKYYTFSPNTSLIDLLPDLVVQLPTHG